MFTTRTTLRTSIAAATLAVAGTAGAQMHAIGPLNQHTFPESFTDFGGTTVVAGIDPADGLLPFGPLPDPLSPPDVGSGNFPLEVLYWSAGASIPTGVGDAELEMAIVGFFANDAVIEGEQTVTSTMRIRADLLSAGTYTVTHPYGVEEFEVVAPGDKAINETFDAFLTGTNQFNAPMNAAFAPIGPTLLEWDTTLPAAPAGYLGDPGIDHTVVGSPLGTNVFRIEGPNVGGLGIDSIETDLFSIAGKLAAPAPTAWTDLGGGLAGTDGILPTLRGTGDLSANTPFSVDLAGAPRDSLGILFVGTQAGNFPFAGGIVVPNPSTGFRRQRITDFAGEISFGGNFPAIASGTTILVQYWIRDLGAPQGFAGSNTVSGLVP